MQALAVDTDGPAQTQGGEVRPVRQLIHRIPAQLHQFRRLGYRQQQRVVLDFAGHGLCLPSLPRRQKRLPQSWIGLALVAPGPVMVFHALAPFFDDVRRVYAQGAGDLA